MASTLINLWSCPRNVSTAFMYSWAQRSDTQVWDEPLYAHYLRVSGMQHPGRSDILASMEQDGERVVRDLLLQGGEKPVAFFKQMTHHLVDLDDGFLAECKNILFIRNPDEILASYSKVIAEPTMEDIGVKAQFDLWERWGSQGKIHAVLDSRFLLMDPSSVIPQLCDALAIPYQPEMLSWPAGPRPEDGIWAPYWYKNVHRSTGFRPYQKKEIELPPHLHTLAAEAKAYYEFLSQKSLR